MTIRTFEQKDRIIIEIENPSADIKKAINAGFNVETIKFLAEKQNMEPQVMQQIVAEIDDVPTVPIKDMEPDAATTIAVEMPEEIPAGAITEELPINEPTIDSTTTVTEPNVPVEIPNEDIVRAIFASTKEQAFNVFTESINAINAGIGTVADIRACLAARKVILEQTSENVINGIATADDNTILTNWNNGLNATVGAFYNEIYPMYAVPTAPAQAEQSLPEGFEPVTAESDIPFTAPTPINADWQ
ncbi:MAG: hypothetical protein J6M08_03990 [Methanobrevibacter sp.]|nr:hypothetical protein [Methanobrevibacter sp.]